MIITKEEILHLSKMSRLALYEEEVASLQKQVSAVLDYAQCIKNAVQDGECVENRPVNVMREDVARSTSPEPLLANAPQGEDNYFVVPVIIDND